MSDFTKIWQKFETEDTEQKFFQKNHKKKCFSLTVQNKEK